MFTYPVNHFGPSGATWSVTPLGGYSYTSSDTTSFTISSVSLGSADSNRYIVLVSCCRGTTSLASVANITSVTIGGVTATISNNSYGTNGGDYFNKFTAIANVPSGTTGDIVITTNIATASMTFGVFRCISPTGIVTVSDSEYLGASSGSISSLSVNVDVPSNGAVLAVSVLGNRVTTIDGVTGISMSNLGGFTGDYFIETGSSSATGRTITTVYSFATNSCATGVVTLATS